QHQLGEPAPRREQARIHPLARLGTGTVTGCLNHAGDFLARDERQGNSRETAAEEPDVPRAGTRGMDPDQHLSRRGYRVGQLTQLYTADPAQLLRQRYSHGSGLRTLYSCPRWVTPRTPPYWVLASRCSAGEAAAGGCRLTGDRRLKISPCRDAG